jgi:hypothetical protein
VFDGNTGGLMRLFFALPAYGTVARVAASDADGDGFADIFVGPFLSLPIFGVFSGRDQSFLGLAGGVFTG